MRSRSSERSCSARSSPNISSPRMSRTSATLRKFRLFEQSSANFGMRLGGRLSTQKYPRSSRHLAAWLLPAPDNPVTMTKCVCATGRWPSPPAGSTPSTCFALTCHMLAKRRTETRRSSGAPKSKAQPCRSRNHPTMKVFRLEEANALLPVVRPLLEDLVRRRRDLAIKLLEADTAQRMAADAGGAQRAATQAKQAEEMHAEVLALIEAVQKHGCVVKDLDLGLVDFPALRNGQ